MSAGTALADGAERAPAAPDVQLAGRAVHLDALRGLAVLAMVVDHLALYADVPLLRDTVGRLALPLFFVLGGHLLTRLSPRLLLIGALGLVLPGLAPWVDAPNVLLWYALGAFLLAPGWRWAGTAVPAGLVVAVALTALANGVTPPAGSYDPLALFALMALGRLLPRPALDWARRLPQSLSLLGRWPLTVYVGHVLLLTVVAGVPG